MINFLNCNLTLTVFDGSEASGCSFDGSTLDGTSFVRVNLEGASFRHTVIKGADFTGANLHGASFEGATYTSDTRWPNGFIPEARGARLVEGSSSSPAASATFHFRRLWQTVTRRR